jgi:hypothetical protein
MNTESTIQPGDVGLTDAARILAFLNSVEAADEITEAVRVFDEPEVGIKIAQRILDRREELGGRFSSLSEVAAVKYVGPERFTELVLTLSMPSQYPVSTLYRDLLAEVQALRSTVHSLTSSAGYKYRITLEAVQPQALLGAPVTIIARASDISSGRPLINQPVVLATTWGCLSANGRPNVEMGNSATARTGVDGSATFTLWPSSSERLSPVQQSALLTMLSELDPAASTPREVADGLQEMVRHYKWATNIQFRRAVDIFIQALRPKLLDTINLRDYMAQWDYFEALVIAYVCDGNVKELAATPVEGSAVLNILFKDWLGPWLQSYIKFTRTQDGLAQKLKDQVSEGGSADAIRRKVYRQVDAYVGRQYGFVGKYMGQQAAAEVMQDFVNKEVPQLPWSVQVQLYPSLQNASNTIQQVGPAVMVGQAQLQDSFQSVIDSRLQQFEKRDTLDLGERLTALEGVVVQKADEQTLMDALAGKVDRDEFDDTMAGKVEIQAFESALENKVDVESFENAIAGKVDAQTFDRVMAGKVGFDEFENALADKVSQKEFSDALAVKVDREVFDSSLANKVDNSTFEQALVDRVDVGTFEEALANKVENSTFEQALADRVDVVTLNQALAEKVDREVFEQVLAGKVANETFESALKEMVMTSTFEEALVNKVDNSTFEQALAERVDIGTFENVVAEKVDRRRFEQALSDKVANETFESAMKEMVRTSTFEEALANKVDNSTFEQALADRVDVGTFEKVMADKVGVQTFETALRTKVNTRTFSIAMDGKVDRAVFDEAMQGKLDISVYRDLSKKLGYQMGAIGTNFNELSRRSQFSPPVPIRVLPGRTDIIVPLP